MLSILYVFVVCWSFSKFICFFKTIRVTNSLNPEQARRCVGPDRDSNYLQRLSADDESRHQQGNSRMSRRKVLHEKCERFAQISMVQDPEFESFWRYKVSKGAKIRNRFITFYFSWVLIFRPAILKIKHMHPMQT